MGVSGEFLNPSEAARRLGISAKALRLYEQRGLIMPVRSAAGWRAYGSAEMERASEIVALRALGFSLAEVARVLTGDLSALDSALTNHQAMLDERIRQLVAASAKVRELRDSLARGEPPTRRDLGQLIRPSSRIGVAFDLPWPWDGERFELGDIRALTYITGPLGSGKTRLARRLAEGLPNAVFVGVERSTEHGEAARARLASDPDLESRVKRALAWVIEDGGAESDALVVLLIQLEAQGPQMLVVDMVEQGLDAPTQEALIALLRRRGPDARPLFLLTRSTAILDLESVSADEAILFCPANHGVPMRVAPYPGAPGYEALASCLASPAVRARTDGMIAVRR
ncbi:MerR family transcriptional regulator [Reyranella sp.]|uniref:MerR family transcriptional regulator n=1 Tax=Reyranella sp. TaxID=1929291 RepID=UPI0037830BD7